MGKIILNAKMKDGASVVIEFENLGDSVPAWDANGVAYEAYTSHFTCAGRFEIYSRLDRRLVDAFPRDDGWIMRQKEDYAHLDKEGVDTTTIEDEHGPMPMPPAALTGDELPPEIRNLLRPSA